MGRNNSNSLGFLGWLGLIILAGFLFFKWIPEWTWQAKPPEITINDSIFETHPTWQGEKATIKRDYSPSIYIRINPEEANDERANLVVLVNDHEVDANCSYGSKYFCYKIDSSAVKNGNKYEIIARNSVGEKHVSLGVEIIPTSSGSETTSTSDSSENNQSGTESNTSDSTNSSSSSSSGPSSSPSPTPYIKSSSCLHYEAGRCWDELENEMYSSGLYDHNYGYYGGSYTYPDDCDTRCQDILEDAYEEGYYDF